MYWGNAYKYGGVAHVLPQAFHHCWHSCDANLCQGGRFPRACSFLGTQGQTYNSNHAAASDDGAAHIRVCITSGAAVVHPPSHSPPPPPRCTHRKGVKQLHRSGSDSWMGACGGPEQR